MAGAGQKTILADAASLGRTVNVGGETARQPGGAMPGHGPPPAAPAHGAPAAYPSHGRGHPSMAPPDGGPRTVFLGHDGGAGAAGAYAPPPPRGASMLFWIVCLLVGLAVGVGAYWAVLRFGGT
jgi:hypothetical protein